VIVTVAQNERIRSVAVLQYGVYHYFTTVPSSIFLLIYEISER
jgi:hypothetical protein